MSKQRLISHLRQGSPRLSVDTLSGSMMNHAQEVDILEKSTVELFHLDVMDGQAWPKITMGPGFLAGIDTHLIKDVHLLVEKPENQIDDFAAAGARMITFQIEHTKDIAGTISKIQATDALVGVGIYPSTPLDVLQPYLDKVEVVFVLAISPSTGKETFFKVVAERVATLRDWKPELVIAVDGGIIKENMSKVAKMYPDIIVTGSAVFDGNDAAANILEMQSSIASVCSYKA